MPVGCRGSTPGKAQRSRGVYVLGISTTIDAGAALVADGRIVAAVNEERLTRHKFQSGIPYRAVRTVIDLAGIHPRDIDYCTLSDRTYSLYTDPDMESFEEPNVSKRLTLLLSELGLLRWAVDSRSGLGLYRAGFRVLLEGRLVALRRYLREVGVAARLLTCDHHTAHAAAAAMTSGWPECLAVTMDLSGDGYCSLVAVWRDGRLSVVKRVGAYHSFGVFYSYVAMMMGHKPGREGKVTGLAAHGDPFAGLHRDQLAVARDVFDFLDLHPSHSAPFRSGGAAIRAPTLVRPACAGA